MMSLLCITLISLTMAGSAYSHSINAPLQVTVKIFAEMGANVTLPCKVPSADDIGFGNVGLRIHWTKVADDEALNEDVLISMGFHQKTYGNFEHRVFLENKDDQDASLTIVDVSMEDTGKYRCELMKGGIDIQQEVSLEVHSGLTDGVVFPYHPNAGRYIMKYDTAVQACQDQGAVLASPEQLEDAWRGGLDWCNAGWLSDGSVKYPINNPRELCGGANNGPGIRSYGRRNRTVSYYDAFCYSSALKGRFYWLVQPERLTFDEAVQACVDDGAEIAKVGHIFSAWKLEGYDRCDAGWLADGSVRYPISRPRKNCSPTEAAVRHIGFPDKTQKSYGVYCYKAEQ